MKLKITILPHKNRECPQAEIWLNDKKLYDGIITPNNKKYFIFENTILLDPTYYTNTLKIIHKKKNNKDTTVINDVIVKDKAIELKSISFDDYKLPDLFLYGQRFYPIWPNNIKQEKKELPEYITDNLYFGFNGEYSFTFDSDYKKWYFNVLLWKEKQSNRNNQQLITLPSGKVIDTFEFAGKTTRADKEVDLTISELYALINQ